MLCNGISLSLELIIFKEQLRRDPSASDLCELWFFSLKEIMELMSI